MVYRVEARWDPEDGVAEGQLHGEEVIKESVSLAAL
jgi:hypothetical protein